MRTAGQGPGGFEKREGEIRPGQDLVMAGYAGFGGTIRIWESRKEELEARFSKPFLRCLREKEDWNVKSWLESRQKERDCPFTAFEYGEEGGVFAALWNLSGVFGVGIDVDLRRIPMQQVTVEICELYNLNPYRLLCENCVLLAAEGGARLVNELEEAGIPAAVIGCATGGIARQIRSGSEKNGYLERPQPDELLRFQGTGSNK